MAMKKIVVLTIGGSDSSGGAGIQADLRAFSFLDLHGASVITAVTAQNTKKVDKIKRMPLDLIENQIDLIFEDMNPKAVKIGMLYDKDVIKLILKKISDYDAKVIVDPVMISTSGYNLFLKTKDFVNALKKYLLPLAFAVTPNIIEASMLTNRKIESEKEVRDVAREIYDTGVKNVIIKGGHFKNKYATDFTYDGKKFYSFSLPKIDNRDTHGSGCAFSALLTGLVAKKESILKATKIAKTIVWGMIAKGYTAGEGAKIAELNKEKIYNNTPPVSSINNLTRFSTWNELRKNVDKLTKVLRIDLIPEVGINFGYALPNAKSIDDVCALTKRIRRSRNNIIFDGKINFCSSRHIASIILAAMKKDRRKRSAMNIKYQKKLLDICRKLGLSMGSFDRKEEPDYVKSTMEWGTSRAIEKKGFVPDIIYDEGGIGKEPMIRIMGDNPTDVMDKLNKIVYAL